MSRRSIPATLHVARGPVPILVSLELESKKDKEQRVKEQRIQCNSVQEETETATDAEVTDARLIPATEGRAADLRTVEPRTATQHTELTFFWSCRVNYVFLWIITEPVIAPLPNIAGHVVKAPGVCRETIYGGSLPSGHALFSISIDPAVIVCLVGENRFAKMKRRCPRTPPS